MPGARQLYVLRHAKSSWGDPGLDDKERPLAPRGRQAVKLLAEYVRANGIRPQLVLVSPAKRTRETLEGVAPGGEVMFEPELYGATAASLVGRLRRVPEEIRSVMLIGHNPAMQVLVSPARRARETLEGVAPAGEIIVEPELYGASAKSLLERLTRVPDEIGSVMLIGHNPAMQALVLELADSSSSDPALVGTLSHKFPTGALATLELETSWGDL